MKTETKPVERSYLRALGIERHHDATECTGLLDANQAELLSAAFPSFDTEDDLVHGMLASIKDDVALLLHAVRSGTIEDDLLDAALDRLERRAQVAKVAYVRMMNAVDAELKRSSADTTA